MAGEGTPANLLLAREGSGALDLKALATAQQDLVLATSAVVAEMARSSPTPAQDGVVS